MDAAAGSAPCRALRLPGVRKSSRARRSPASADSPLQGDPPQASTWPTSSARQDRPDRLRSFARSRHARASSRDYVSPRARASPGFHPTPSPAGHPPPLQSRRAGPIGPPRGGACARPLRRPAPRPKPDLRRSIEGRSASNAQRPAAAHCEPAAPTRSRPIRGNSHWARPTLQIGVDRARR